MSALTKMFLSALIKGQSVNQMLSLGKIDHLFKEYEQPQIEFVMQHVKKYGKFPSFETYKAHLKEDLPKVNEPAAYYRDLMQEKWMQELIKTSMSDAQKAMVNNPTSAEQALSILANAVMDARLQQNSQKLVNFKDAINRIIPWIAAKQQAGEDDAIQFGWPTLDDMVGGIGRGDLISFVGRPAMGKTWFLIWAMLHAFSKQKKRPLFVSMEMTVAPIENRLASLLFKIPVGHVMKGAVTTKELNKLKVGLTEIHNDDVDLYVVDGNLTSTVEDVWALASALNVDAIYIDGGYLMKHPKERDRFKRVAENCNLMKMELTPLAPTTVSWQFSRSGAKSKKKKGEKAELEDIGYTDAIGQDSSLVAALSQPESLETIIQREVDILKGRQGETGKFRTNWNFQAMDFSEVEEAPLDQLQYS